MNEPFARWQQFRRVFRLPFSRRRGRQEVDEELAFHLHERAEEFRRAGLSRADAEAEAHRRFGDYHRYRAQARTIHEATMSRQYRRDRLAQIHRELRHAARALRRAPGFALIACLTLALGIGATTAVYMVLDAVALRPLPYRQAEELVAVLHPTAVPGSGPRKWGMSAAGYFYLREHTRTLAELGGFRTAELAVTGDGAAEMARVGQITHTVFGALRAQPAIGRLFIAADDQPGAAPVVVLSHEFWRRRFGGDPGVVGQPLPTIQGPMEIVGVAEVGLSLPMPGPFASRANLAGFGVDLWMPLRLDPAAPPINSHQYSGIGRLRPGVTAEMAERDLQSLVDRFTAEFPAAYSEGFIREYQFRAGVTPLRDEVLGPTLPRTLWVLFGAVGLVLLIAGANVANLFLVRMETRRREAAIRSALGAGRGEMAIHHLAEALLLTGTAGILGVAIAWAGVRTIVTIAPTDIPRLAGVGLSGTAVIVALGIGLITGVALGLVPVLRRGVDLAVMREGGRGLTAAAGARRVRGALVVGQVALALVLLAAAGLMIKSFWQLREVQPGLDPSGVVTLGVALPFRQYPTLDAGVAFHRQVMERIAALPGVVEVGAATSLPLRDFGGCSVVFREGLPYGPDEQTPCVATPRATPGFFAALGIAVAGRAPEWRDVDGRTGAAVVTRALADRLWPGEDPLDKGITTNGGPNSPLGYYRVVGVIPELRATGLDQPPTEAVFYPAGERVPDLQWAALHALTYVIRTTGTEPASLVPAVRAILSELNPEIPLTNPETMTGVVVRSMARTSFLMVLLGIASAMALLLSAVGLYGVISYLVAQRRGEIGIRMALGARVGQVATLVVRQSLALVAAGIVLGVGAALAGTRALRAVLFEVNPTDPGVLVAVSLLLVLIAAAASLGPARRAARVEPVEVLKGE